MVTYRDGTGIYKADILPDGVTEITEEEYNQLLTIVSSCPHRPDKGYRLREDLTWEEYDLPPEPVISDEEEITDEEAYNIIMGVSE